MTGQFHQVRTQLLFLLANEKVFVKWNNVHGHSYNLSIIVHSIPTPAALGFLRYNYGSVKTRWGNFLETNVTCSSDYVYAKRRAKSKPLFSATVVAAKKLHLIIDIRIDMVPTWWLTYIIYRGCSKLWIFHI